VPWLLYLRETPGARWIGDPRANLVLVAKKEVLLYQESNSNFPANTLVTLLTELLWLLKIKVQENYDFTIPFFVLV
jgi:hypothetical protein